MKILLILTMLLTFSGTLFATDKSELATTFHQRLAERMPDVFNGSEFLLTDNPPAQVREVIEKSLDELLSFASELDLFARGFSYALSPEIYQVKKGETVIDYTFSIVISKNGLATFRRFYNLARRVDGAFYVDHIATYDIE